jgi:transcription elongation factor S-II
LDLPPARLKIANLFLALFLKYPEGQEDVSRAARVAVDIEQAMQDVADYRNASKQYGDKARSLKYNLDINQHLRLRVVLGDLRPLTLIGMKPEDMQPEEHRQAAEAAAALAYEANLLDWQDKNAEKIRAKLGIEDVGGSFTCGRCKGNKTSYQAKQTRSSDEPMTMFVRCLTCGNRWKE